MEIEERSLNCDVLVVGAGPSGISAAIAASRQGADVLLVEEDSLPGGAPIDMYVCMTCGAPRVGVYLKIINHLNENYTLDRKPIIPFNAGLDGNNHWWTPYSYVQTIMTFLNNEPNIKLITGLRAVELLCAQNENGETVVNGIKASKGVGLDLTEIKAQVTIDATGTGILGELAGCDVRYGADIRSDFDEEYAPLVRDNKVMPCTLKYISQRLSGNTMPEFKELSGSGFVEDKLNMWASAIYDRALVNNVGIYLHWGATVYCDDTRDNVLIGNAHRQALAKIENDAKIWYKHGFTINIAPKLGIRECRRVMGDYVLTIYDMLNGNFEHDTVAISSYGVDLWGSVDVDENKLNRNFKPYGIPYRALVPKKTEGLLMAGKSISGSRFACSSYRVQPIVASIGEACGVAAAIAVKDKVTLRNNSVVKIQSVLQKSGIIK